MASTYTSRLRLVKPTTGELTNTWGDVFNQQFSDLIDAAIAGYSTIALSDVDTTLTATNGAADESRQMMLKFTGVLTANRNIVVPTTSKMYFVHNATTGGYTLTVKTSAGTGVAVLAGDRRLVASDGTNVVEILDALPEGAKINGFEIGYKDIPQISKSANYTTILSDAGKHIYHPAADTTARVWTIPANGSVAYPVGTAITFINDLGAGSVTLNITSDTLVDAASGSTGARTLNAPSVYTVVKVAATRWMGSGNGVS
jgi:hypothetical protein